MPQTTNQDSPSPRLPSPSSSTPPPPPPILQVANKVTRSRRPATGRGRPSVRQATQQHLNDSETVNHADKRFARTIADIQQRFNNSASRSFFIGRPTSAAGRPTSHWGIPDTLADITRSCCIRFILPSVPILVCMPVI